MFGATRRSNRRNRRLSCAVEVLEARQLLSTTVYVDASATGANNGTSWANAYTNLQPALTSASAGETIDVAQGTYAGPFQLLDGVGIYGGFAGNQASNPNARNVSLYPTILSGNNVTRVVVASNTNSTAVLDGVTITGGLAGSTGGGGLYESAGGPTINNCIFTDNASDDGGGAMYNSASSPTITNCTFLDNTVTNGQFGGGGMCNLNGSSPIIVN